MNYSVRIPVITIFLISLTICLTACKEKPTLPVVTTTNVTGTTQTTANSGGNVTSDGNADVTSRGVCWNSSENPTVANSNTSDGNGTGIYTSSLTLLTPGTTYYVKAYATNSEGTAYGSQVSFSSNPVLLATLTTTTVTSITSTTAVSGGNISADGGGMITERGVCWGITSEPTISGNKTTDGNGTGSFTSSLTGLDATTTYYVRAYATNSAGTAYGNQLSLYTLAGTGEIIFNPNLTYGTVSDIDGNSYKTIQIGTQTWMAENLKTTKYNDNTNIPLVADITAWQNLFQTVNQAYCWYNNDIANKHTFGALYNWYAVGTGKLCPTGWHVPSDPEFITLTTYLGGESVAGGKLKEIGTTHWGSPNNGATNESGFTALPSGDRDYNGASFSLGSAGIWWSSTFEFNGHYWCISLHYSLSMSQRSSYFYPYGLSVRCLKNN